MKVKPVIAAEDPHKYQGYEGTCLRCHLPSAHKVHHSLKERPIEHLCRHGLRFACARADLGAPVLIYCAGEDDAEAPEWPIRLAEATAEFIGWHAMIIHPKLTTCQGYDCVQFRFEGQDSEDEEPSDE